MYAIVYSIFTSNTSVEESPQLIECLFEQSIKIIICIIFYPTGKMYMKKNQN